jgi:S-adenosylmethionine hydrolase
MIVLFTDFGADDIYAAQVKAVLLLRMPPGAVIIDLLHSAPNFDAKASAHLLASLHGGFPLGTVFLTVIDPGVGSARSPVVLEADGKWFVGPDNGLLSVIAARAKKMRVWRIVWRPDTLSASFHGRDLFAPIAAWIAQGGLPVDKVEEITGLNVQLGASDLPHVIYIDHYGNSLTGLRACNVSSSATIEFGKHKLRHARVFAEVPAGAAFWYENSEGLVEIAVNRGNAAVKLGVKVGDLVTVAG